MNRKVAVMLLGMWGVILFGLIVFAYNNPQTFVQTGTNPSFNPDQVFGGFQHFIKDMTDNITPPPGLR